MNKSTFLILSLTAVFLSASPTFAQDSQAPGCGDPNAKFSVKTTKGHRSGQSNMNQPNMGQPDSSKALIYFLGDDTGFENRPQPTTRTASTASG
jgi:hypothetical protein